MGYPSGLSGLVAPVAAGLVLGRDLVVSFKLLLMVAKFALSSKNRNPAKSRNVPWIVTWVTGLPGVRVLLSAMAAFNTRRARCECPHPSMERSARRPRFLVPAINNHAPPPTGYWVSGDRALYVAELAPSTGWFHVPKGPIVMRAPAL